MRENTVTAKINKPVPVVFTFCITPPNSSRWIPGVIAEETSEWPIRVDTLYRLKNEAGIWSEVMVSAIKQNEFVEFSKNETYHCRYTFKALGGKATELIYHEWTETGELYKPFTQGILENLKHVIENTSQPL